MKDFGNLTGETEQPWVALAVLMLGAFALYAGTFGHDWSYDDFMVIVDNPDIRSWQAFLRDTYPGRPLRELTYLLDHALFGLKPAGWHIQNIFWHGLNAGLLWLLVRRLGSSPLVAWTASLLFLVHPVQVEVVANISHRKDSLSLAFCLLSFLAYIRVFAGRGRSWIWLAVALALAWVALLAKQNAVVLGLVFLAYELAFLPREKRLLGRQPAWLAGIALAVAVGGVVWLLALGGQDFFWPMAKQTLAHQGRYFGEVDAAVYFGMILKSWTFMAGKLFWPFNLAVEYYYPVPQSWLNPWVIAALGLVAAVGVGLFKTRGRHPLAFFALVWIVAFWLPTANLWPLSYFAADRYLYAPSVGFFLLLGLGLERIAGPVLPKAALLSLATVALVTLSWRQAAVWQDDGTLFRHAIAVSPGSARAQNELGKYYDRNGRLDLALRCYQKAVTIEPRLPAAQFNLASLYEQSGNVAQALPHYRKFLELKDPVYAETAKALAERLRAQYGWSLPTPVPPRQKPVE